ncbi:MAG: FtsW/RodA/SpoVE family cell cycle protein [bacterium]
MKFFKKYYPLIFIVILTFFSLLNNYNARYIHSMYSHNFLKQTLFFAIGYIFIFLFSFINEKKFFNNHFVYYIISAILLFLVLFFGTEVNGAKAWFNFNFFSFQPSELMKFTLAISLTKITTDFNNSKNKNDILFLSKITLLTLIPSILVFVEPDTGAIIFYFLIFITSFFFSKIKRRWIIIFLITFFSSIFFFVYIYFFNTDLLINLLGTSFFYRVDRIINISDNYQINNAITLIGSRDFFENNLGNTSLYIPEAPTDFMFAYNFGNFGLFGALCVLISYFLLILSILLQTKKSNNKLYKYMFIWMLTFGVFYNILMNIGLLPIMGIALPFLSYGGSSILIYFLFLGLYFKTI